MRISYSNCVNSGGKYSSVSPVFGPDLLFLLFTWCVLHVSCFKSCGPGQRLRLRLTMSSAIHREPWPGAWHCPHGDICWIEDRTWQQTNNRIDIGWKECKLLVDPRARKCYQEKQSFKKPNQKEKIPRVSKMFCVSISGNPTEEMIRSVFKILGPKMFITELLKIIKKLEIT